MIVVITVKGHLLLSELWLWPTTTKQQPHKKTFALQFKLREPQESFVFIYIFCFDVEINKKNNVKRAVAILDQVPMPMRLLCLIVSMTGILCCTQIVTISNIFDLYEMKIFATNETYSKIVCYFLICFFINMQIV